MYNKKYWIIIILVSALGLGVSGYYNNLKNEENLKIKEVFEKADEVVVSEQDKVIKIIENTEIQKLDNNTTLEMDELITAAGVKLSYPKSFKVSMMDNNHLIFSSNTMTINIFMEPNVTMENITTNSLPTLFNDYLIASQYFDEETRYVTTNKMNILSGKKDEQISNDKVVYAKRKGLNFKPDNSLYNNKKMDCLAYYINLHEMPVVVLGVYDRAKEKEASELIRYMASNVDKVSVSNAKNIFESKSESIYGMNITMPIDFEEVDIVSSANYKEGFDFYMLEGRLFKNIINYNDDYSDMAIGVFKFDADILYNYEYSFDKMISIINGIMIDPYSSKKTTRHVAAKFTDMQGKGYDEFLSGKCIKDKTMSCNTIDLTVTGDFFNTTNSRPYYHRNNVHTFIKDDCIYMIVIKGDQKGQEYEIEQIQSLIENQL